MRSCRRTRKVLLLTGAAGRDERKYPDADRFDIHRAIDHHVAFGYGIHFCLGAALARLEGRIGIEETLRRYPTWDVDHDRVVRLHTSTVRGYSQVPITSDSGMSTHEPANPRCCRRRRAGAPTGPNVLVIVLDDLGFAQLGCFGSDIATPNIDALAAGGLRYNRFHVTALCSPTRAAVLTGRNHHAVGMGMLPELAVRYEGYNGAHPARRPRRSPRHLPRQRLLDVRRRQVAPRAARRSGVRRARSTAGRSASASSASTGSSAATPTSGRPS